MPVEHRSQIRHHHQVGREFMWASIALFRVTAVVVQDYGLILESWGSLPASVLFKRKPGKQPTYDDTKPTFRPGRAGGGSRAR